MSTSRTTPIDNISSILLGLRRMPQRSTEKILTHLRGPASNNDYHYLDALATLCTFGVASCDSVAAAVEYGEQCNRLYLATRPSSFSTLPGLVPAWIELMQSLSCQYPYDSRSSARSEAEKYKDLKPHDGACLKPWDRDYTVHERTFIIEVYRVCSAKLLDVVNGLGDIAEEMFDWVSNMDDKALRCFKVLGSPLAKKLQFLIKMAKSRKSVDSLSATDLLHLHCAAGTVASFKDEISFSEYAPLYDAVDRLSDAVDTLINFASSARYRTKINRSWTYVWVDVPECAPAFVATTNTQELAAIVTGEEALRDELVSAISRWKPFVPPAPSGPRGVHMHMLDESPDHFTGNGIVHSEAALISYFYEKREIARAVEPYLGCSHPICYPCLMLVRACNLECDMDPFIEVGRRCLDFRQLDVAWAYPREIGLEIYGMLLHGIARGFERLCTQVDYTEYSRLPNDEASEKTGL